MWFLLRDAGRSCLTDPVTQDHFCPTTRPRPVFASSTSETEHTSPTHALVKILVKTVWICMHAHICRSPEHQHGLPYTRFLSLHPGPRLTVWSSLWFAGEYTHIPNPQQVGEDSDGWLPQQPAPGTGCDSLHLPVGSLRLACASISGSGDTHYSHLSGGMQRPPPTSAAETKIPLAPAAASTAWGTHSLDQLQRLAPCPSCPLADTEPLQGTHR